MRRAQPAALAGPTGRSRPAPPHGAAGRPRRALAAVTLALVVTAGATLGACSSSGPAERSDAEDAAATVAGAFQLSSEQQACLADGFDADPRALAVVGTTSEPSATDQEALGALLESCVPSDQFASSVAAQVGAALPPTGSVDPNTQVQCVATAVRGLDAAARRTLFVGLVALTAPPTGELAIARNDVVNGLYEQCGVSVGG